MQAHRVSHRFLFLKRRMLLADFGGLVQPFRTLTYVLPLILEVGPFQFGTHYERTVIVLRYQ